MNNTLESVVGKYFIIAYALFALGVYVYVFFCTSSTCGAYIILPVMPWAFIWVEDLGLPFPWAIYPLFILLNASVAYVLGVTVEWLYSRYLDYKQGKKLGTVLDQKTTTFHK